MGFLVCSGLAAVLLAFSRKRFVKTGRRMVGYRRARRTGVELQAEVVDNVANPRVGFDRGYALSPVVCYYLDGRSYEAVIVNASGFRTELGSFMTIVVNPDSPDKPYDRYQGMGDRESASVAALILIVGLLVVAILFLARH
jgi:hypothetical protein